MTDTLPNVGTLAIETVPIDRLRNHPRNYQSHPDDQLAHLVASLTANGWYRPVVVARDNTILAGHGIVKAARKLGLTDVPIVRLDLAFDDPRALKVVIGDNEIRHLADRDDRLLSELLKEIKDSDADALTALVGTGYDAMMLANLVFVTRPASEVATFDEAAEWVGMPDYTDTETMIERKIYFRSEENLARFCALVGLPTEISTRSRLWWPPEQRSDNTSVKVEG